MVNRRAAIGMLGDKIERDWSGVADETATDEI